MNPRVKKTLSLAGYGLVMLLLGIGIGSVRAPATPAPEQLLIQPSGETLVESQEYENLTETAAPVNKVEIETVTVARVIDGDTIELASGERVRYIGIDTPETVDPRKPVQCFGVEASTKNKELVEGKEVRLEKDVTDRDKYGRLLRYVYAGDTFVNLELVRQGFAYSYTYPPDVKRQDEIVAAQGAAQTAKAGLWTACPPKDSASSKTPTSSDKPAPSSEHSGSCAIKGNISSSGEKIYHMPGCGSYSKTVIDESRGEKMFCAESEAQAAGWRKALNCP